MGGEEVLLHWGGVGWGVKRFYCTGAVGVVWGWVGSRSFTALGQWGWVGGG